MTSYVLLTLSMNYNFFINNGSEPRLFNHTGDIIHSFTHGGRGIRICTYAMLGYVAAFVRVRILLSSRFLNWLLFNQEQRRPDAGL